MSTQLTDEFLSALAKRRTHYSLDKAITASQARVEKIVEAAVQSTPSAFNSQSARVVLLFGEHHDTLWQITKDALRKIVPAEAFAPTEEKINSFAAAAGTILYFDDTLVVKTLQEKFPLYSENFPIWAEQASGMLQSNIWVALATEGLGASLQHYGELVGETVKEHWNLPSSWKLIAQMPFGNSTASPSTKDHIPIAERVKVFRSNVIR